VPARVGIIPSEATTLTLDEAVALALENNADIAVARLDTDIADYTTAAARGAFDPAVFSEPAHRRPDRRQYQRQLSRRVRPVDGWAPGARVPDRTG
jgi:outer membrane protein TolC